MAARSQINNEGCLKKLVRPSMSCVYERDYSLAYKGYKGLKNFLEGKAWERIRGYRVIAVDSMQDVFRREVKTTRDVFSKLDRVLIVVGKTGTGKTSLIDTLLNYSLGVKFDDEFRYTLKEEDDINADQTVSQTQDITVYAISMGDIRLGLMDTPGFCDTNDKQMGTKIPKKLKTLLDDAGHPIINGICFVVKGSETRLGDDERRIFNDVLKLFPKTAKSSTFACFTFCDKSQPPQNASQNFSRGINEDPNRKAHKEFAFDNASVLFGTKLEDNNLDDDDKDVVELQYKKNFKSCEKLFQAMKSGGFDSKDISKLIGSREDCDRIMSETLASIARTCENIVNLHNEEKMKIAGKRDIYCKECNTRCCYNCTYGTAKDCDKMVTANANGFLESLKWPFNWIKNKISGNMECQQCEHDLDQHEAIQAKYVCPDKEISRKIDEHLETASSKLQKSIIELKGILEYLETTAWCKADIIKMDVCKNSIIQAVKEKCKDSPEALKCCEARITEAFNA